MVYSTSQGVVRNRQITQEGLLLPTQNRQIIQEPCALHCSSIILLVLLEITAASEGAPTHTQGHMMKHAHASGHNFLWASWTILISGFSVIIVVGVSSTSVVGLDSKSSGVVAAGGVVSTATRSIFGPLFCHARLKIIK